MSRYFNLEKLGSKFHVALHASHAALQILTFKKNFAII
jgi:hypothetical protein